MSSQFSITDAAKACKQASLRIAQLTNAEKNSVLEDIAKAIIAHSDAILDENQKDIDAGKVKGLSNAMLDRLLLTPERIADISDAIIDITRLDDPTGSISNLALRPNGIQVGKMRIPLGVIAMIYEARPNVTAEAAALCLKSGNGVVLRGGSEAIHSNKAIARCIGLALKQHSINQEAVLIVPDTSRAVINELLTLRQSIDLVIPRGGEGLINFVTDNSAIPVIQHFKGVCHLFVDKFANLDKALNLLINGKTQKPSACNAIETLIVHQDIAEQFLPIVAASFAEKGVKVHACDKSLPFFQGAELATDQDYDAEYLDDEIAIKVVNSYESAIDHINQFSSDHTEVIVTQDTSRAQQFVRRINSSVVMVNASSRFSDGGQLGLGAEIGISTSRLHAYGPMGLEALTTEKFVVFGDGHTR
ncbi:glutamate-5-semialdehyde dehydrogenase [Thalassotalea agarivorans]|uniref:Gamma-glutamyl phosphate reductase n=1 Tax=Thalassotalea agarivorans TaxID=349064 RepID=A0A1I0CQ84_THASX|nr:glutamate-5-semialdehyde dehydrogenase [Thalassotalea agarivorans]SET21681.1 glutamate-5-semialdehyde dehydrogenase [Thalassotalea agarivorans]